MAKIKIPLRPNTKTKYELSNDEMDCVVWNIVFNQPRIDCWMRFVCPEAEKQIKAKKEERNEQWWSQEQVRKFIKDYNKTLDEVFNPSKKPNVVKDIAKETEKALNTFRDDVIDSLNTSTSDVDVLKEKAQLAKTVGILKEEEEVQVAPIRYLPQACNDSCAYRLFCEKGIKDGDIINECDYCKALKFAKDNGFSYDPTRLLDLPKEE